MSSRRLSDRARGILALVFTLNVVDGVFTVLWVTSGAAREANPLMASLIRLHPVAFMVVKLALVALGSILLWRLRHQPPAIAAVFAAFLVYYAVLLYHLAALSRALAG